MNAVDPERAFLPGPMNGRIAQEAGAAGWHGERAVSDAFLPFAVGSVRENKRSERLLGFAVHPPSTKARSAAGARIVIPR